MEHVLESQQFDKQKISRLFSIADDYSRMMNDDSRRVIDDCCKGIVLCSLFYEPSTRTRFSFESAILRLGGGIISTEAAEMFSSVFKGETLEDTIRVIHNYCDVVVLRHKDDNAAEQAARLSKVPIINAGCGRGQHPTQSLLDLYTINKELGRIDDVKVAIVGDLKNGRTVRSLAYLLGKFSGTEIVFVSPSNLPIGQDIKDNLSRHNVNHSENDDLRKVLSLVDIVYMTRIQKERMTEKDYVEAKGRFTIGIEELGLMKPEAILMHPLPHREEISLPLDVEEDDPKVAYFRQAENGLYVRMGLLKMILGSSEQK